MKIRRGGCLLFCTLVAAHCSLLLAQPERPAPLRNVGIDQRLDEAVPAHLAFRDDTGRLVQLGEYYGRKPIILALVYYDCPMLCTQVLNGLVSSLRTIHFTAGKDFTVVVVSFDPHEGPALAASKKRSYVERYAREGSEAGWQFLTGDEPSIQALTQAVGFRYQYDPQTRQFAHASGIILLTPGGRVSRYFYGIEYAPRDLRLGLVEASDHKIGSPVDQLLLFCYHYDPATGEYGAAVMNLVRLGGFATILSLAILLAIFLRRDATRNGWKSGRTR